MTRLRNTIAKRLVSVQQETAMLTTFNEVDMLPIKEFEASMVKSLKNNMELKLGFMGFFVIAAVQALKKFPIVNASIDGSRCCLSWISRYRCCCIYRERSCCSNY